MISSAEMDTETECGVDETDDIPAEDQIFSSRFKAFPRVCPEDVERLMKSKLNTEEAVPAQEELEEVVEAPRKKRGRGRGRGRGAKSKAKTIIKKTSEEILLQCDDTLLSRSAKRRLERLREEMHRENQRIETENALALAFNVKDDLFDEVVDVTPQTEGKMQLKVQCLSETVRITCDRNEKFSSIFCKVADAFNLKPSEMLLCHNHENIQVDDTPDSLNIRIFNIIECIPYKCDENSGDPADNRMKLKLQSNDSRKKVDMSIHKLEKMQDVFEKYASLRNIPVEKMVFEFDGEKIEGSETAEDLEMESGSCIDVTVLQDKPESSKGNTSVEVVDLSDELKNRLRNNVPQSSMLQIIEIN